MFCCRIHASEIVHRRATAAACNSADCRKRPHGSLCWTKTSRHRSNSSSPGNSARRVPATKRGANSAPEFRARGIAFHQKSQQVFLRGFHLAPSCALANSYFLLRRCPRKAGSAALSLARHGRLLCRKIITDLEGAGRASRALQTHALPIDDRYTDCSEVSMPIRTTRFPRAATCVFCSFCFNAGWRASETGSTEQ